MRAPHDDSSEPGLISALAATKGQFGRDAARHTLALLERISDAQFSNPADLIHLHETLLFTRAFPQSPRVLRLSDQILFSFADRLRGVNLDVFEDPEVSGIAGTGLSTNFSHAVARSLIALRIEPAHTLVRDSSQVHRRSSAVVRHSSDQETISIDWENFPHPGRLGSVLSELLPESREDFGISAHPDARAWFARLAYREAHAARRRPSLNAESLALRHLIERTDPRIYDLLEIPLRWQLDNSAASRSRTRIPRREIFYHDGPFLKRADVSLAREFAAPKIPVTRLARPQAEKILDLILDTSAVRYRELYGFSYPDRTRVHHADLGRGMDFFFFAVDPRRRLIRDYHAGMYFKNGVPIGYVELLSEKDARSGIRTMEVGFNLYYTFREAETAWLYARLLKIFRERLGATRFSIDPYQLGQENEEAVESGAFWFYRKLGFRSTSPEIAALIEREESKIAASRDASSSYRTPPAILRKLARAPLIYD